MRSRLVLLRLNNIRPYVVLTVLWPLYKLAAHIVKPGWTCQLIARIGKALRERSIRFNRLQSLESTICARI